MALWACLYTHQKTKKAKTWKDGLLRVSPTNNKVPTHAPLLFSIFFLNKILSLSKIAFQNNY